MIEVGVSIDAVDVLDGESGEGQGVGHRGAGPVRREFLEIERAKGRDT